MVISAPEEPSAGAFSLPSVLMLNFSDNVKLLVP